ncbi:MAG: glycosyltransferase [Candidatus Thermochlorobacter aerophilum]|uniref:Glycosyltransferase n=1 Tax=Candidatus Thermochlorobacter aerophilus TaxID=1868324 RepID=A0A395LY94_9BACT|nr:MAG: glycosyltransferase [Candidatus Thermochlorobacter aerophilum]
MFSAGYIITLHPFCLEWALCATLETLCCNFAKKFGASIYLSMILSVVIVSYNVKTFLEQCLRSVLKAAEGIESEIFVVDNNSVDGTEAMLMAKFSCLPNVHLIFNRENLGFSKANNQALRRCRGRYVLVLNPDTLVQEDTFRKMIAFMEQDPTIGAAGCKLLNADGSFQLSCRRSFPTPEVSFYKIIGLSALFPQSRRFARYNLTYLPIDATYEVDALMGAFMFIRREVLEQVGLFDESFFMYGEDLDLCYRIKQAGWKIYYYHETQIIHYKGESTKKESFNYVIRFYEAMLIFVRKHYRLRYSRLFEAILVLGIYLRASLAFLRRLLMRLGVPLLDLVLIVLSIFVGFRYKFSVYPTEFLSIVLPAYTAVWVTLLVAFGQYRAARQYSLKTLALALCIGFLINASLTFFFKQYAFSRVGLSASFVCALLFLGGWRVLWRAFALKAFSGTLACRRRLAVVGTGPAAIDVATKLQANISKNYDFVGYISTGNGVANEQTLGRLENIVDIVRINRIDELVFVSSEVSNMGALTAISKCSRMPVACRIAPSGLDVMISSGSIEDFSNTIALVDVELALSQPARQISKRIFDVLLCPLVLLVLLVRRTKPLSEVWQVLRGKKTWVGVSALHSKSSGVYAWRTGVWSLAELQHATTPAQCERADLFYAKNSSLGLDTEILFKSLFSKSHSRYML